MPKKKTKTTDSVDSVISSLLETQGVTLLSADDVFFEPRRWTETDVLAFQACIGARGVPSGRIIEITGWESAGKSTLLDQIFASYQKRGQLACLADTEQSRQKYYTGLLGCDPDRLVVLKAHTIQGIGGKIGQFLTHLKKSSFEGATVIGWDTVANTPSDGEFAAYMANAASGDNKKKPSMMDGAKALKAMFRALMAMLQETDTTLIATNQWYSGPPEYRNGPPSKKTYGGTAMRYMPSIRVEVVRDHTKAGGFFDALGKRAGHYGEIRNIKNKIRDPHKVIPYLLIYGQGFCNVYTVATILADAGVISRAGSWSSVELKDLGIKGGGSIKWQNRGQLMKALGDSPETWSGMVEAFWECQGI
jgi:recombination protein RecA